MTEQQHIKKGFNAGYQLEKHAPELSQTIQKGFPDKEHPYAKGFIAGSQEFTNEKARGKTSSLSKYMNPSRKTGGKSNSKNSKDFDMEK